MGQFSWLDCCNKRPIVDNLAKTSYLLIPKEFKDEFGPVITEPCYAGYGRFGGLHGYDAYALVALWNRKSIGKNNIRVPDEARYSEPFYYEMALARYKNACERIEDFAVKELSHKEMIKKYGDDYLREIGIDIACYDEENAALEYPLKITYNPNAVYEACPPSLSDPGQGWDYLSEEMLQTDIGKRVDKLVDDIADNNSDMDRDDILDFITKCLRRAEQENMDTHAFIHELGYFEIYLSKSQEDTLVSFRKEFSEYSDEFSEKDTIELD